MDTEAQTPLYTVAATPYAWPWHGSLDPARVALVACVHEEWRGAGDPDVERRLASLAAAVHESGGLVVALVGASHAAPDWLAADTVVAAPGSNGFYGTGLDALLRAHGLTDLLLAGWGLEGPVHSTMRAANDRGYECLLVADASTARPTRRSHAAACSMVMHSGGIFGAYARHAC